MIDRFEVLNYRSVLGRGPRGDGEAARLEVEDDVTTLIGKNEAGKSNLLRAANRLGDQHPLASENLSSYETYDGPIESVEILRCRLDPRTLDANAEQVKPVPWLLGPYWEDDLSGFPVRIPVTNISLPDYSNADVPTKDEKDVDESESADVFPLGQAVSKGHIEIVHYASGDHAVDVVGEDETGTKAPIQEISPRLETPIPLDEFIVDRHHEHLRLCWWFIQNISEVSEYNPEIDDIESIDSDKIDSIPELHNTIKRRLERISDVFDGATPIEESDINSEDEAAYAPPKVTKIQKSSEDLLRTLSNVFNPPDPLNDLPNIIDQSEIELVESEYNLHEVTDSPALQGLLSLDNIEITSYSSYDSDDLRNSLDNAVDRLSDYLNEFWEFSAAERPSGETISPEETDRYTFSYEMKDEKIRLKLSEEDGPAIALDQRSDGMRWIITFLLKILAQPYAQSEGRQTIVILDDPGIHLHPEAEKQLFLAFFHVTNQAQIIYSTHSPALIDPKEVARLRIIRRKMNQQGEHIIGTTVANDLDKAKTDGEQVDPLATARDAVGWTLSDSLFRGETTILVEGSSDKRYLNLFNSFLMYSGRTHIEDDPKFINSKGLQLPFLSRILAAEDVTHVALMDDDSADKDFEPELEERTVRYNDILMPDTEEYDAEIEDLFDRELFIRAAADVHDELDAETILQTPYDEVPCGIVDYVENFLDDPDSDELKKDDISKKIKNRLGPELNKSSEEHNETIRRFEAIITELKTKFDEFDDG